MAALQKSARSLGILFKQAYDDWSRHNASRLAASLAFYTALSLAPLLVIVVAVLSLVFGDKAAHGQIVAQFQGLLGAQGAQTVESVLASSRSVGSGVLATVIGFAVLLVGASGVFGELQGALDIMWNVKPREGRGLKGIIKDRFLSFSMVMGVAFLLLVSLVITATLSAVGEYFSSAFGDLPYLWQAINLVVSFAVTTGIFALIFNVIPDVRVPWRDVWVGALFTAGLFTLGKFLIGLYLGRSTAASAYGAAGSVVAVLIWVYYSAQILFFGAELTQVVARHRGSRIVPMRSAVFTEPTTATPSAPPAHVGQSGAPAHT
jgi:membrane protein